MTFSSLLPSLVYDYKKYPHKRHKLHISRITIMVCGVRAQVTQHQVVCSYYYRGAGGLKNMRFYERGSDVRAERTEAQ